MTWLNRCHFGDCRDLMRTMIADGVKVQTIVTSPPYWGLRDYGVDGRQWIGCELNPAYEPLQRDRLRQPGLSLGLA